MLQELRDLNLERPDLDELVALHAFASGMEQSYSATGAEPPEWFKENKDALQREIKNRRRDSIERALKDAKARKEKLKTMDEKRADLDAEIARLSQALQ